MNVAVREATVALVVDNSEDSNPDQPKYLPAALFVEGELVCLIDNPPDWVADQIA